MTATLSHFNEPTLQCPLCRSQSVNFYLEDKKRQYLHCANCDLVFVPKQYILSPELEKAEYDKHDNTTLDEGYRRFLNRTLEPLISHLTRSRGSLAEVSGLDFGCGEGAFLSQMAAERGLQLNNYDLYYHKQPEAMRRQYDIIVMTEVLEHIAAPDELLETLLKLLRPEGLLAIMTKRVMGKDAFAGWHYKNDPTHLCFYSEATFQWLAARLNMTLTMVDKDVVFLQRNQK